MATLAQRVLRRRRNGLVLWHLLSLDAPSVAALWTWFAARCARVALPATVPSAMFLAVWLLYAADRLLDARAPNRGEGRELEERHRFHWKHRREFGVGMALAGGLLLPLIAAIYRTPQGVFPLFVALGTALAGWFGLIHLARPLGSLQGAKELIPGLFFGAAVFLPAWTSARELRSAVGMAAGAFALVCWLNCRMIFRWEHEGAAGVGGVHAVAGVHSFGLALVGGPAAAAAIWPGPMTPSLVAVSLAAAGLLALDRYRRRLERTTLRAAADLVLLTPLLVTPFLK